MYDVVKIEWLERCVESKKLLTWYVLLLFLFLLFALSDNNPLR